MDRPTSKLAAITAAIALAATATGCSNIAENAGERIAEEAIEQQGGGNVDLDFGGDGFSFDTEDGSFSVDEDGNFVITGPDGEVITGRSDGDGNVVVEGPDGSIVASAGDGGLDFSSDEGDFSFGEGSDIPDTWPTDVPLPSQLTVTSSSTFDTPDGVSVSLTGTFSGDLGGFVDAYGAALQAAGFDETSTYSSAGNAIATYASAEWLVNVTAIEEGGAGQGFVSVTPA